jgi:hypothetical protein
MPDNVSALRNIPSVDQVLRTAEGIAVVPRFGHPGTTEAIRAASAMTLCAPGSATSPALRMNHRQQ